MEKIRLTGRIPSLLKSQHETAVSRRKEGDRPDNKQKKESQFRRPKKNVKPVSESGEKGRSKSTLPKKRGNSIDIEA